MSILPTRPRHRLRPLPLVIATLLVATSVSAQLARQEKATLFTEPARTSFEAGTDAEILVSMEIDSGWHTNSNQPTYDYLIATEIEIVAPEGWPAARVAYPAGEMKTFSFAEEAISVYEGAILMVATQPVPSTQTAGDVEVLVHLTYQACDDRSCLPPVTATEPVLLTVGGEGVATATAQRLGAGTDSSRASATGGGPAGDSGPSLLWMMLLGLVGGLILNAMPCVLPVLSLKLFGLVKSAGQGRAEVVRGSLATSMGILVSFWALAALAIVARSGGNAVGWGIQFQEPTFVAALTIVVVLFCLNLWGLFEVPLPGRLAAAGGGGGEGLAGHFTTGLFATLMATPCSAPFLGTAIGFGLSQSAGTIMAIFTAVGLGMAVPYLALAIAPGSAKYLPKPGPWMTHLRTAMGFLLAGAAVWLLYVLSAQISAERLAFFEIALLIMAMLIWWRGTLSGSALRQIGLVATVATIALGLVLVRAGERATAATVAETNQLIQWKAFDRDGAERLADQGRLVFVDVTADWCFTCKVNERLALETESVAASFAENDVVAMKADWTNRSDEIARFLSDHGRYGIPFYLLYRPAREPHIFGELISSQEIIDEVETAAGPADGRQLSSLQRDR